MMEVAGLLWVGAWMLGLAGLQESPADLAVARWIEKLSSADIEERQAADRELRAKGPALLPSLRDYLKSKPDPESRARVELMIRDLLAQEAAALARKGNLKEALLKLAIAEGATDPQGYCAIQLSKIKKEVASWYPSGDRLVRTMPNIGAQAKALKNHGLWGVKFLMDEITSPDPLLGIPANELILALGTPALPPLIKALESPNPALQESAAQLLHEWPYHPEDEEWAEEWLAAATRVGLSPSVTPSVRGNVLLTARRLTDNKRVALVERLGATSAEERRKGEEELRKQGPEIIPELRRFMRQHPDSKGTVDAVVSDILEREANALADQGSLDETLLQSADPVRIDRMADFSRARLKLAEKEARELCMVGTQGNAAKLDVQAVAQKLWNRQGLWGVAILVRELGSPSGAMGIPSRDLLEAMGKPALPHLVRALSSKNEQIQTGACSILHAWATHPGGPEVTPEWIEAAHRLADDPKATPSLRETARTMTGVLDARRESTPPKK